jgi:hypothetical protein
VSVFTDLISGNIDDSWFELKEGSYFAHIRRNANLTGSALININQLDDKLSTRIIGIGNVLSSGPAIGYAGYVQFDSYPSDSMQIKDVSDPDQIYTYQSSGALVYIGDVALVDNFTSPDPTIYLSVAGTLPAVGSKVLAIKNSTAESYGARGYYMDITLSYDASTAVELFEISSSVFKSFM